MSALFTSHWRNAELADLECVPVGISRGEPRWKLGYRYRRYPTLAPNDHVWSEQETEAFESAYRAQLDGLGADRIVSDLRRISEQHGGKALCLLCWERLADPDEYCHRLSLSGWLETRTGLVVPELRAGDLPRREDVLQRSLF